MSRNTRTLLTVAAELRAVGHPWSTVAERVNRKPRTCQSWPTRYRDDWAEVYRDAQQKRFDETSNEAHSLLKGLMRSAQEKTRLKAIEIWLKCGANAYGLQGKMVVPGPAAEAEDPVWAMAKLDIALARDRINQRRAHEGLPPPTDDEFLDEWDREVQAICHPNPIKTYFDADGNSMPPPAAAPPASSGGGVVLGGVLVLIGLLLGSERTGGGATDGAVGRPGLSGGLPDLAVTHMTTGGRVRLRPPAGPGTMTEIVSPTPGGPPASLTPVGPPARTGTDSRATSAAMSFRSHTPLLVLVAGLAHGAGLRGEEKPPYTGCAAAVETFFTDEVWGKVAAQTCLTCHKKGGDAEESTFILRDPQKVQGAARDESMRHNRDAFARMARLKNKDQSRLLLKVVGGLDHGGKDVLKADSAGYRTLATFVRRVNDPRTVSPADLAKIDPKAPPFFDGVAMLDDRRLLRRLTLSLAGRLPTDVELAAVKKDGLKALPTILDAVMKEDAFYARLREGFNDIFLTLGVDGNPDQTVLSYDHFPNRHWYQKHDLSHIKDEKERRQAGYKLANEYRKALLDEPMRLVEHIVRTDKPFTEVVTADYVMLSPYTARGYGVFEEVKGRFKNPDDPFEYIPVKLKALVGRSKDQNQDSATGFYPHAGLLSTFQYLARYPTTETNRNRLRARMYYQHFLGVDVLELAARVSDAAAAQAKYEVPTMQAAECAVCHRTLDPAAGLFQDYWRFAEKGVYGKRKGGWFKDMFGPGFEGEDLPSAERWRSLQWLGERTAQDPRFAVAMVEHVYYILTGRKVLLPPKDLDDPLFPAKRRAYAEQRREVERIASRFVEAKFNLKVAFKDWATSPFYRADGPATVLTDPKRRAELDDVGLVRMLAPEQVERKVAAVFGEKWGRLTEQMAMLYGGIDSQEVTDRATDPSGAMGAIQRILSNDVACKHVARDFARPAKERKLFPTVDPETLPGTSAESDAAIRKAIVHLHERVLGRYDAPNSAEVERTFHLFAGIVADAKGQKGLEKRETYHCRSGNRDAPGVTAEDPHYTIRAWRGVVTYLLRRQEFLYE